jgi:FG-GAP repeat
MFSAIPSFSLVDNVKNIYSAIRASFDFDMKFFAPKLMNQAAFDKAFWAGHYHTVLEELAEDFTQKNSTEQSLELLKERLLDCQSMIGRRSLSPKAYEEGIQDLIELFEEDALEDESLSAIAILHQIRSDFQGAVKEQSDFIKECFMGDVDHLVSQWLATKISPSHFKETIAYYADVMEAADYYQGLLSLKTHFQADVRLDPLLQTIDQLLSKVDLREVAQSREALRKAAAEERVLQSETVVPEAAPGTLIRSHAGQQSSFVDRLWQVGSGVISYIITHPLQALTAGLAAQTVITMAFNNPFSLATLDGQNGFNITGIAGDDLSGSSVAGVGDVNGDGIGDFIIGAPGVNSGAGASYVVFGHTGSWASSLNLVSLNGANGFAITGIAGVGWTSSGVSVASAGDVNGDSIGDFIIGAPGINRGFGASYVVFGHRGSWPSSLNLASLNGVNGFSILGISDSSSGRSVAGAGDVNGDGIGDFIIGAPWFNSGTGESYVVFGHTGSWASSLNLASLNGANGFSILGISDSSSGGSVAGVGDVNGDGIEDFMINAGSIAVLGRVMWCLVTRGPGPPH